MSGLSEDDVDAFAEHLVPWDPASGEVFEQGVAGEDVFDTYEKAIRPCFEAWYDAEEDDFAHRGSASLAKLVVLIGDWSDVG